MGYTVHGHVFVMKSEGSCIAKSVLNYYFEQQSVLYVYSDLHALTEVVEMFLDQYLPRIENTFTAFI